MPRVPGNIPTTIFYRSLYLEPLDIARCTFRIKDFIARASDLFSKMVAQGESRAKLTKELKRTCHRYPTVFSKVC